MTGNEKKIAKIFSFIALAAAKLKFCPSGRELLFNLLSNSVVSIFIMRRSRFQQCESALINVDKNFPIRALKNHTYNRATGFDPSVQGTQPIVRLAGAARPVKPQVCLRQNRRRLRCHLGQLGFCSRP